MPDREKIVHQLEQTASFLQRFGFGGFENIQDAIAMLKEQEIVRCKDCKHQHEYRTGSCPYYTTYGSVPPDNWFCADGERRADDD